MREATLGGMSALDARPPRAAAKTRSTGANRGGTMLSPRLRRVRAHLALVVGSAGFSAIMIGIILNATVMQKEHHPAPLFGAATTPARVAAASPAAVSDIPPGLLPASPTPPSPVAQPSVTAASPMVAPLPSQNAGKVAGRLPQTTTGLHPSKPADGIARFLTGPHIPPHAVVAAHGPAKPISTQPKSAAVPRPRPAVPVATRSDAAPAAVN